MKNILYAVIAVLGLCIGVLFYQVQDLKAKVNGELKPEGDVEVVKKPVVLNASSDKLPEARIAFVNIDTLNENYLFISDYVKVLKNKRLALESQM